VLGGGHIREVPLDASQGWQAAISPVAAAAGFLAATWIIGVRVLKRPWRAWGWRSERGLLRRVLQGVVIGAVMATVAIGLALLGGAELRVEQTVGAYVVAVLPLIVALLAAALAEELTFRGLPLQRLADVLGVWPATLLLAVGFGLAHLGNPAIGPFGLVNIALAGLWLSVAFFSPGGMGLAWGLHFGWNAMLALGFDAPVSGIMMHVPGPEYTIGRYAWFDGGTFGPEGGLVATIALIGGTAYLLRDRWRRPVEAAA